MSPVFGATGGPPPCHLVNCFVDPCLTATCPGQPAATCRANYCGGCYADFYVNGQNVTACCTSVTTTTAAVPQLICPPLGGIGGICSDLCTSNADCRGDDYLCCSNGCGHSCMQGNSKLKWDCSFFPHCGSPLRSLPSQFAQLAI